MWKAALIRCIISWFGRISLPHVQRIVSLNTACPHEGHWWISEVLNSMSSTLAMSWAAWVDSWLNSMPSFARSSRIHILFEPTSIRSIIWFFASSLGNVLVVTSTSSVRSSSIVATDCSQLPGAWSTSGMCFEPSWTSSKSSLFCLCHKKNSVRMCARSGMLLLALPILAQRCLARWPWSFKLLVKVFHLHHLMPHDQCNLQVSSHRSWLQTTSSARIPIQGPPLLTIVH